MGREYYYLEGNERKGPLSIEQLKSVGLKPDTWVWTEGLDEWKPAKEVEELKNLFKIPTPHYSSISSVSSAPKRENKMTCEEQMLFCRKCLNSKVINQDVICKLNIAKPTFKNECPEFKLDEMAMPTNKSLPPRKSKKWLLIGGVVTAVIALLLVFGIPMVEQIEQERIARVEEERRQQEEKERRQQEEKRRQQEEEERRQQQEETRRREEERRRQEEERIARIRRPAPNYNGYRYLKSTVEIQSPTRVREQIYNSGIIIGKSNGGRTYVRWEDSDGDILQEFIGDFTRKEDGLLRYDGTVKDGFGGSFFAGYIVSTRDLTDLAKGQISPNGDNIGLEWIGGGVRWRYIYRIAGK